MTERRSDHNLSVQFEPFVQSHIFNDVRLALATVGSVVVISAVAYGYLVDLPWKDARPLYAVTVGFFFMCYLAHTAVDFFVGPLIFVGSRAVSGTSRVRFAH